MVAVKTIEFGLGKTYDWGSSYWSTLTNVQDTNASDYAASDGYKILGYISPSGSKIWTNLTGWTETSNNGADSSSDGNVLIQTSGISGINGDTAVYKTGLIGSDTSSCSAHYIKFSTLSNSTSNGNNMGVCIEHDDATRVHNANPRLHVDDANVLEIWGQNYGGEGYYNDTEQTGIAPDYDRWHQIVITSNRAGENTGSIYIDGKLVVNGALGGNEYPTGGTGRIALKNIYYFQYMVNKEYTWRIRKTEGFTSLYPWATDDGVMESDPDATDPDDSSDVFDAGEGNEWGKYYFEHDISNSTAITHQVRCASTKAGLSSATYETIATSGDDIVTKGRWIQQKKVMADASSGQYTPILKTSKAEAFEAPAVTSGFMSCNRGIW